MRFCKSLSLTKQHQCPNACGDESVEYNKAPQLFRHLSLWLFFTFKHIIALGTDEKKGCCTFSKLTVWKQLLTLQSLRTEFPAEADLTKLQPAWPGFHITASHYRLALDNILRSHFGWLHMRLLPHTKCVINLKCSRSLCSFFLFKCTFKPLTHLWMRAETKRAWHLTGPPPKPVPHQPRCQADCCISDISKIILVHWLFFYVCLAFVFFHHWRCHEEHSKGESRMSQVVGMQDDTLAISLIMTC